MPQFRIREAADLLGVSDDTVRRWIDAGSLPASKDDVGRKVIDGVALAEFSRQHAASPAPDPSGVGRSARNRFVGLVTKVDRRRRDGAGRGAVRPAHGGVADEQRSRPRNAARTRPAGRGRGQGDHGDHRNPWRYPRESSPLVRVSGAWSPPSPRCAWPPLVVSCSSGSSSTASYDHRGGARPLLVRGGELLGGAVQLEGREFLRPRPALLRPPRRPRRAR